MAVRSCPCRRSPPREADRPSRNGCRNEERTPPATASSAVRPTAAPAASTVSGFGGRPLAPLRPPKPRALLGNCGHALSNLTAIYYFFLPFLRGWKGAAGSEERLMGEGEETMLSANGRAQAQLVRVARGGAGAGRLRS